MKRLFVLCLLLFSLSACTAMPGGNKIKGSGVVKKEKREIAPFTAVEVSCPGTFNLVAQERKGFEIGGDDNIVPLITTEVKNNTLYIKSDKEYDPKSKLQIDISNPDIEKFVFTGAGEATLAKIKNNRLEITMSGAGELKASGETREADISVTGAGTIDAKDLHAEKTRVSSMGAGNIDVYATEQLDVNATGVGDINYYGNPKQVNKKAVGLGGINQR